MAVCRFALRLAFGFVLMLAIDSAAHAQSIVHLPLMTVEDSACRLPAPDNTSVPNPPPDEAVPSRHDTDQRILPVGHQLDDVGQYYSQVSPSLASIVHIANLTSRPQPFNLTLYGDTGNMVRSLQACRIEAGDTWLLQIAGEQMVWHQGGRTFAPHDLCDSVTEGQDAQGHAAVRLHGLYHAQITADDPSSLAVRVYTRTDPDYPHARFHTASEYEAVPVGDATGIVHLPGILATRDREAWWDTEVIVQNVSDAAIDVKFNLCADTGACFDNNAARLAPYERRLFLASHLLYQDTPGGLVELAGWYAASVHATRSDDAAAAAPIAVAANYFRQEVEEGSPYPQAEVGSQCLHSTTPNRPARAFELVVDSAQPWHLRIYNPSATASQVTLRLLGPTGRPVDIQSANIAAYSTWELSVPDPANRAPAPNGGQGDSRAAALTLHIRAENAVSVLAWDNGGLLPSQPHAAASHIWYAPLVAAPVVPFRWDAGQAASRAVTPAAQFGLAETRPQDHQFRPNWAQQLNWYDATFAGLGWEERWCHEAIGTEEAYSTYIPVWPGLRRCNPASSDDRSCVNTDERLQQIRNTLPSSCAGRPLFLACEPDLGNQASMTYHELGRMIYVLRDWPGELFSPAFASYSYEQPIYPPEDSAWCREAVAEGLCPQTPGCERCRQDGVVDGAVDPYDISFKGLEEYFAEPHRWAHDQAWQFDDFIEGMLLHFYPGVFEALDAQHWRVPYLQQYRDRAAEVGWPIIVTEYGFAIWPNEFGEVPDVTLFDIADHVDDVRRFLQAHLGGGDPAYGGNPFKLFWYQTGCDSPNSVWGQLCLFHAPERLADPVGVCWHEDAIYNDGSERQCGQARLEQQPPP